MRCGDFFLLGEMLFFLLGALFSQSWRLLSVLAILSLSLLSLALSSGLHLSFLSGVWVLLELGVLEVSDLLGVLEVSDLLVVQYFPESLS